MSQFTVDGIIFEEILSAIAENSKGELLYRLTQLSEATIDVTAEAKEAKDKDGTLIKKSYNAKAASLKVTNAHLDLNAYAETTGSAKIVATETNKIQAPKILLIDACESSTILPNTPIEGTITVTAIKNNGAIGEMYKLAADSTATKTEYAYNAETKTITFPIDIDNTEVSQFLIKYEYMTDRAVMVDQRSNKFPKTVKLTVQALYYDPCETDCLRLGYIVFPSFQVSPETSMQMKTDATFEYKGDAQLDYCSKNKRLYYMVIADNDIYE